MKWGLNRLKHIFNRQVCVYICFLDDMHSHKSRDLVARLTLIVHDCAINDDGDEAHDGVL